MNSTHESFVVDHNGQRTAVLIDIDRYRELLEAAEELACIRDYDSAKSSDDAAIPFSAALHEIEDARQ